MIGAQSPCTKLSNTTCGAIPPIAGVKAGCMTSPIQQAIRTDGELAGTMLPTDESRQSTRAPTPTMPLERPLHLLANDGLRRATLMYPLARPTVLMAMGGKRSKLPTPAVPLSRLI